MQQLQEKKIEFEQHKGESSEQAERRFRIAQTTEHGLNKRRSAERRIRNSLMLYSGQTPDKYDARKARYVAPYAFIFVEAKTAEEVRAMSDFELTPVDNEKDEWKVDPLKDVLAHVESKAKWRRKRIEMLRMKNIAGVSVGRVGYRLIMGKRPIGTVYDEYGRMTDWEYKDFPVYDDLFIDVVPPLNFVIDPNVVTIDEAMWCGQFSCDHILTFREKHGFIDDEQTDDRFYDVDTITGGDHDYVGKYEHFDIQRGEWVTYAFPYSGKAFSAWENVGMWREIGAMPLADDNGKLPFFAYQDNSSFSETTQQDEGATRSANGEELTVPYDVNDTETFWKQGVPTVIEDLIDLRTDFGRSLYRGVDLAAQVIYATAPNYSLDEARPWRSGMQAIGALGKLQPFNLGGNINIPAIDYAMNDLFEQMVMAVGADPRNLTDIGKVQTATQSMIQNETAAKRLNLGITYNEENGELRRGELLTDNIQQYYTKQEVVRLRGDETDDDLKAFTDITYMVRNGEEVPVMGKRYRVIRSTNRYNIEGEGNNKKVKKDGTGVFSFLASPDTIRTSGLDIRIVPKRRAGQSDAIMLENKMRAIEIKTRALQILAGGFQAQSPEAQKMIDDILILSDDVSELLGVEKEKEQTEDDKRADGTDILEQREQIYAQAGQ